MYIKLTTTHKGEPDISKPTANTHLHLLSARLYGALVENTITDVQLQ
jgi:hypothetical protein